MNFNHKALTLSEIEAKILPVRYSTVLAKLGAAGSYPLWVQADHPLRVRGRFKHFADGAWLSGRRFGQHLVAVFETPKSQPNDPDATLILAFIGSDFFVPPIPLWKRRCGDGTHCWGGMRDSYYAYVFETKAAPEAESPYVMQYLSRTRGY
jgi:hypothetical protein